MERPSDTPFFVGKNVEDRRHGLRLIHGRGEDSVDRDARRMAADGQYIETVIFRFLTESGLDPDDFGKITVDPGLLEEEFTNFIKSEIEDATLETGDTTLKERKLLESMTFADVVDICERWAQASRESVRLMPLEAPEEIRNVRFPAASYFATLNMFMQEAVSATATQKAASRNIVIVRPDESPNDAS